MSDSLFRFDSLSDIMLAVGNDSVGDAKRILAMPIHHRVAAIKRAIADTKRRAAAAADSKVRNARRDFDSIVFPKATKRVSSSDADHTLRLSSGSSDSKAMKAFLANGGSITVLPTRNSKGFKPSKVRVSGGSGLNSADKSRRAHSKAIRDSRSLR